MGVQAVEGSLLLLPDLIFFGFGPLGILGRAGRFGARLAPKISRGVGPLAHTISHSQNKSG